MSDKQKDLIREVFLRNGFTIKVGADDLADYVYTAAHELLQVAPAVQGEPVGYGLLSAISKKWDGRTFVPKDEADEYDDSALLPLYTAPQPAEQQPAPEVAMLVEALEVVMWFGCNPNSKRGMWALEKANSALAAHRKWGDV